MMGEFGVPRDKWGCPNDRQLALRAKLKKGWSVKASSVNSFAKPTPLSDVEQEFIVNVIKRAENLDRVEQERVGRLVERLDNMKKNAMGNGTSQCVLCADEFGILGASPLLCNDCKKAVCTKCGVDTLSALREPLMLCKICAETRETWKKSGAWFYKGLPKYILPEKRNDHISKYSTNSPMKATTTSNEPITGSPVRSYNAWLQNKGRSGSDKEYTDSSEDELKCGKLSRRPINKRYQGDTVESYNPAITYSAVQQQQVPKSATIIEPTLQYAVADVASPIVPESTNALLETNPDSVPTFAGDLDHQAMYSRSPKTRTPEPTSPGASATRTRKQQQQQQPRRDVEEEPQTSRKHRGHARHDSVSSTGSYDRSRASPQLQYQQQQQQLSPVRREEAAKGSPTSFDDVVSPDAASKIRKKLLKNFRKKR